MSDAHAADSDIGGMFDAIDAQDSAGFVSYLTDGAVFRYGSAPPVKGRAGIQAAVDGFFGTIKSCSHQINRVIHDGKTVVCEGDVTYRRLDGGEITLPFTNVLEYEDGLVDHYKIYIDIAPLYAE